MNRRVYIIAEAGVNHNGDLNLAKRLAIQAKQAGADAVKFQTFKAENLTLKQADKAEYQKKATPQEESQFDMLKKLELSYEDFIELKDYCDKIEIQFLSTPFDEESIDFLHQSINIPLFKIPSGEITNIPYLEKVARCNKPIILSTGMSTMEEVDTAIKIISKYNDQKITLLHCSTDYPAKIESVNLNAMVSMEKRFDLPVGYSDHTLGILVPVVAASKGASVIEKHFTLDKKMPGPDHAASLVKEELGEMVRQIRLVESILGDGIKRPTIDEEKNISIVRKSIVAKRKIHYGETFSVENITTKRPGDGISAIHWYEILGKTATKDYEPDDKIEERFL